MNWRSLLWLVFAGLFVLLVAIEFTGDPSQDFVPHDSESTP